MRTALNVLRGLAAGLETALFPSTCRACGVELEGGGPRWLCSACRLSFSGPLPADWGRCCYVGGATAPGYAALAYDGPAGAAVRLLKYEHRKRMASLLANGLAPLAREISAEIRCDVAVPVPLHPRRRRERGFNQSAVLAAAVAAAAAIPFLPNGLARVRDTKPQVSLAGRERRDNVKGAFAARADFGGKRCLLVDDVITTGATVSECARALYRAGAASVVCCAPAGPVAGQRSKPPLTAAFTGG